MQESITIQKEPVLDVSLDYNELRRKGMEYIQQLGSRIWTDYNIHDPGITLLELLCYALTDLGYRSSYHIKDLLAVPLTEVPDPKRQAFFTAREILTVNPWTPADFRKLLIDVDGIRNAWLACKQCPCNDLYLYAHCKKSILQYEPTEHAIVIKGFYDVLVEFEDEEGIGDLNSGKIKYNFSFSTGTTFTTATIEMRLPSWQALEKNKEAYKDFRGVNSEVRSVTVRFISGNKGDDVDVPPAELANVLRRPVYATVDVEFLPDADAPATAVLSFTDIPLTVWFRSDADRKTMQLTDLASAIEDASPGGIFSKYLEKLKKADAVMKVSKNELHSHRNLCEDYCSIQAIEVEDIAVCTDMEVEPHVDIEAVLAQAYFLMDQYFSPAIQFYSLQQLLDAGQPVDEIFEGPALSNGFIDNEQLESTNLKRVLYTSDIISLLMDIPGVKAVRNFALVRYDDEGKRVESQPWSLEVSYNHQPRLYIEGSKFLVFKNGLPFLPDRLELADTLQVIKGQHAQPKYSVLENDLLVPQGTYHELEAYHPLQYSLPLTYGVGKDGLPYTASAERKAQAKQLKAYLLFYEQLLVNYLAQLAHVKELFAVDEQIDKTYFSHLIGADEIVGTEALFNGLDEHLLHGLGETQDLFHDRRNRFLDHLLARFAEQFNDYALMLYSYATNKAVADGRLIRDKIAFIRDYPFMSSNRARSFNYKDPGHVCNTENIAGLVKRIERLLGFGGLVQYLEMYEETDTDGVSFERRWRLRDETGKIQLSSSTRYVHMELAEAERKALEEVRQVYRYIVDPARYEVKKVKKWVVNLLDETGEVIATRKQPFRTKAEAEAAKEAILEFGKRVVAAEQIFVVEHLLLRPRNAPGGDFPEGDPLLSICIPDDCRLCGEEDPYSFRLTVVINGEEGIANNGIEFRRFAEQTIRLEVPAHLGVKICWVDRDTMLLFQQVYCDWLAELAKEEPDPLELHNRLKALIEVFLQLKSVYPKASLHDCVDGDDTNRVYLNQTII